MRSKGLTDGQDPVTGADSQLHFVGKLHSKHTLKCTWEAMNTLPSLPQIPTLPRKASQCTRNKPRLKPFSGQKGYKVSLGNVRNGPQSSHVIQEMVWFPLLLHQMPGETLGKSCRRLFGSPTQWQSQEPIASTARAMLTNKDCPAFRGSSTKDT